MPPGKSLAPETIAPPPQWPLYVGLACLLLAITPWLLQGLQGWRDDDQVRGLVTHFFTEMSAGQRDAALACLTEEYRSAVLRDERADERYSWPTTEQTAIQILSVQQRAETADVRVALAKSGFSIKPVISLRRMQDRRWKITQISGGDVDPRWTRWKAREAVEAEEALAKELATELQLSLEPAAQPR